MNAIGLITKWSTEAWDEVYKAESRSSLLDANQKLLKFTGVKTVRIAKFSSSGLSDYHRAASNNENIPGEGNFGGDGHDTGMAVGSGYGYERGDVNLSWEEFTLRCDRGTQLRIELFDDEETGGLAVGIATKEFSRTQVIPEVDAYVFSKLAELAGTTKTINIQPGSTLGIPTAAGPIYEMNAAFLALAEAEVPEEDQVIFCSNSFYNALRSTGEIIRTLNQAELKGDVKFTVGEYEGRKIIPVPANRFKTMIKLIRGGYSWESGSKSINFIVCAKSAVYHIVKYDKVRVFEPGLVQDFDGYKVNVRVYHDVFVPDNKRPAVYACLANDATSAVTSERTLTHTLAADGQVASIEVMPRGDLFGGLVTSSVNTGVIGGKASELTGVAAFVPGVTVLSAGTYYLYGVDNGMITGKDATAIVISA